MCVIDDGRATVERLQQDAVAGSNGARTIITVVNSLSPTSMPLNEFVSWRSRHIVGERHRVISLVGPSGSGGPTGVPESVPVEVAGGHFALRRRVRDLLVRGEEVDGEPAIVHAHHPRSGLMVALARLGARSGVPVLFTVHNMYSRYHPATRLLSAASVRGADHVTFVSHAAADAFPERLKRGNPGAFTVIPNGVDLERVDATLRRLGTSGMERPPGRAFRLINVGKFTEQKGHAFLLDVMRLLPDVELVLVGEGSLRPAIQERVERDGLAGRVRFTGLVPRERVYEELREADLFVSPALWEGLPIAVLEAMALAKPVLLSDIAPHREIRREEPDLPLLAFRSEEWAGAIRSLADRGAAGLARLGATHRSTVERAFTLAGMHERYTEVYESLASAGSGAR